MNNPSVVPSKSRSTAATKWLLVLLVCLLVLFGVAVHFHRDILDWAALQNYTPPTEVTALADDDTMTDTAERVFYVNHPDIEAKQKFATNCQNKSEQTIVLGCYHGGQQGIFVLSVSDPRLDGVMEVTAAHEMLHAEYDRLSAHDREQVDGWLQDYYKNQLKDKRVLDTIAAYKKTEPNDVVNEMHSVFGTEVADLPSNLETYYQRYFTNRAKVVHYSQAYSSEFTRRQKQVAAYDAELTSLKSRIDTNESELKQQQSSLSAQRNALERDRNGSDAGSYNARVNQYNAAVDAYNNKIAATKQMIAQYNDIVEKRNAIAVEEQSLAQALNGDAVPPAQ